MWQYYPSDRPSLQEIQDHDWFAGVSRASFLKEIGIDQDVLSSGETASTAAEEGFVAEN